MTSTTESSICNQKVKVFLEEYKKPETQKLFKDLAEATRQRCEESLNRMKIKAVVQSRSKGYDSLETKLNDMAKTSEFMKWVVGTDNDVTGDIRRVNKPMERMRECVAEAFKVRSLGKGTNISDEPNIGGDDKDDICDKQGRDIYEHPDMGDLAGVRIGLFFPGNVLKVAKEINEIFNVSFTFGTVTDPTRSAVDGRNQDIQRHGNGRWISQDAGEDVHHHWEHYGYKSWQVVIEWKRPLPKDIESIEAALALTGISGPLRTEI